MIGVIKRNKLIFVLIGLMLMATLFWFFIFKQSNDKIPSRGVYVFNTLKC